MAELNERIKIARTMSGLSQDILAKNLGVMQSVVMRYEKERRPPDASLKKLAELTGFPMNWFWLEPVTGILTFRPERPGAIYSPPQIRAKEKAIARDWPLLIEALQLSRIVILQCRLGGVVVAYSDQVCVVVVGTHSIDTIQRVSLKLDRVTQIVKGCKEEDFLNCWMQPEYGYLKAIIGSAGADLEQFAADIPDGEYLANQEQWMVELEVGGVVCDEYRTSAENDKIILDNIVKACRPLSGVTILSASIKRHDTVISEAPANWKFRQLTVIPEGETIYL